MERERPDPRLLSHRLRGFDEFESTSLGMERALKAGVHHVEFDVRLTRDNVLVAFHDPHIALRDSGWAYVDDLTLDEIKRARGGAHIATLEEMCRTFAAHALPGTSIHVDVKVDGQEVAIWSAIERHHLIANTVIVSWMPSVLTAFHRIAPHARLCFSHLTLNRAPWLFSIARAAASRGLVDGTRALGMRLSENLARDLESLRLYVHQNGDPKHEPQPAERLRSNPGHLVPGAVTGEMRELLRSTRGFVCVPISMASRTLAQEYSTFGIGLAVFSAKSATALSHVHSRIGPDIIYVDTPKLFGIALP